MIKNIGCAGFSSKLHHPLLCDLWQVHLSAPWDCRPVNEDSNSVTICCGCRGADVHAPTRRAAWYVLNTECIVAVVPVIHKLSVNKPDKGEQPAIPRKDAAAQQAGAESSL